MNKQTDYITLMHENSEVGSAPTRFSLHPDGDRPVLLDGGRFSFLFVLQGELVSVFSNNYSNVELRASQMVVIDKHKLRELRCVGDTVILEFMMSDKMTILMRSTSRVFKSPYSEIITLNATLQKWCKAVFADLAERAVCDTYYHHCQCRELTTMLLNYPYCELGGLYVSLYACSQRCDVCSKLFVRH